MDRRQFLALALGTSGAAVSACGMVGPAAPAEGAWRPVSGVDAPTPGTEPAAFWTGQEALLWNGSGGGLYNPAADRWRPIAAGGVSRPPGAALTSAAWTGRELLVWDGQSAAGARYDATADRWAPMAARGAPSPRVGPKLVWTGADAVLFGGVEAGPTPSGSPFEPRPTARTGGRYDPATDTWRPIAASDLPHPGFLAVWSGKEVLAWGGVAKADMALPGAAYDPAADRWRRLPTSGEPFRRTNHALLWTGSLLVVVGGSHSRYGGSAPPALDGGAYDPAADGWRPLGTAGAPAGRARHAAAWTGREVLVWGGENRGWAGGGSLRNGSAYDPATGIWRAMPIMGAPAATEGLAAIWTGEEMLVWGGQGGAAYRPG